ncbi:MAG TPA: LytTR family DNA-binding domain-containing protein, partial [Steroidobacteraceae bacterium]|nr:LytTR family DNA-binding domain-containing protein [Steroidobacteraceae bacterium]
YAVEAFEAHAVGYLLKPVRKEQLAAALIRAGRLTRAQLQTLAAAGEARRTHIAARSREGLKLIPIEEVRYFLADRKYTTVSHLNGEDLIEDSLRLLESEFGALFVRIHRNALVAVKHLERIERDADGQYFVRLRGSTAPLAVSRRMAGELKDRFRI